MKPSSIEAAKPIGGTVALQLYPALALSSKSEAEV
jgi:hypothetical protein